TPKAEGLTPEQLCTAWAPPSTLTLQGLMHHMADVNATGSAVCWPRRNCRGSTALTTAPSTSPRHVVRRRTHDVGSGDRHRAEELRGTLARRHATVPARRRGVPAVDLPPHDHRVRPPLWARGPHPGADRRHHRSVTGLSRACRR